MRTMGGRNMARERSCGDIRGLRTEWWRSRNPLHEEGEQITERQNGHCARGALVEAAENQVG
jgi:hypothetical protein